MGTRITPGAVSTAPSQQAPPSRYPRPTIDSKTMTDLTFTAYLHYPPIFSPLFPLHKLGRIFGTLEIVFETLVRCLLSVGLAEINSFLVSLPLRILSVASGQTRSAREPRNQVLWHPCVLGHTVKGQAHAKLNNFPRL